MNYPVILKMPGRRLLIHSFDCITTSQSHKINKNRYNKENKYRNFFLDQKDI